MRHDARSGPILGGAGALVRVSCLALNLWSFLRPPRPDLGPLVGLRGAAVWRALGATPSPAAGAPEARAGGGERTAAGR